MVNAGLIGKQLLYGAVTHGGGRGLSPAVRSTRLRFIPKPKLPDRHGHGPSYWLNLGRQGLASKSGTRAASTSTPASKLQGIHCDGRDSAPSVYFLCSAMPDCSSTAAMCQTSKPHQGVSLAPHADSFGPHLQHDLQNSTCCVVTTSCLRCAEELYRSPYLVKWISGPSACINGFRARIRST